MLGSASSTALEERLPPALRRLWSAHQNRLPNAGQARLLLLHWLETAKVPATETQFLHLAYLAACSEPLFLALLRHADQISALSRLVSGPEGLGREGMDEALARFTLSKRWPSDPSAMSAFRSLQTARILLQDVLGILPFDLVTRELSCLADVLVGRSMALTFQPLRETMGLPQRLSADGGLAPCGLAAFALGKLGAMELNYASDVDLVFFYRAEGTTDMGQPNAAFFNAWVQAATALLTSPTPDGPCLRLDTNLRPRGRDGELTISCDAALAYYREWADLWERQAWMKARVCAGDLEVGASFLRQMEAVIYRPYAWHGIAEQNRQMRERAVAKLGREEAERDVKEGPGGVRDAEFAVQALQMACGQEDRWVREPQTLLALTKLRQKGFLTSGRHAALSQGYLLLRRAEHWAQVQHMRQTHRLPSSDPEWEAMGRFLHEAEEAGLRAQVAETRKSLRGTFLQVLSELSSRDMEADQISYLLSQEGMRDVLQRGRFPDPERALPLLSAIYAALSPALDLPQRRDNFVRVHYSLQREFERARDPLRGLQALHRIVLALASEPGAVLALLDRPRLARVVFRLASRSEPLSDALQRWPSLLELLGYEALRALAPGPPGAGAETMDADGLRRWQKERLFLADAREIVMGEGLAWSQSLHTEVADACCAAAFAQACREVEVREGLEAGSLAGRVCLLALGRFGFREMHPRSDLDLVCVKRAQWILPLDPDRSASVEERLLRSLTTSLTAVTRHGALYPVDFRLRPYGASGAALCSLEALGDYFSGPAQLWERLAYLKGRAVVGDLNLGDAALHLIWSLVFRRGTSPEEVADLLDFRRRLDDRAPDLEGAVKFAPGGLLQLDLLLLLLQVKAGLEPAPGGTPALLLRLEDAGVLDDATRAVLFQSRSFQDSLLHRLRLHYARPPLRRSASRTLAEIGADLGQREEGLPPGGRREGAQDQWAEHRKAVESAWSELLDRAP